MDNKKRLHTFDFLRGVFVFLALLEHYNYFMNHFFIRYYNPTWFGQIQYGFVYSSQGLPIEESILYLMKYLGAWVSQVFVALVTFNLAYNSKNIKKEKVIKNNISYGFLFIIFSIENIFVGKSLGESFSPGPLQNWMLILIFINTLNYFIGSYKTIFTAIIIGFLSITPFVNKYILNIENYVQTNYHVEFNLECRPDLFLIAAAIGYIFGKLFVENKLKRKNCLLVIFSISFFLIGIFGTLSPDYTVNAYDILQHEYDWSYDIWGILTISATISAVLSIACLFEQKNKYIKVKILNTIGKYSLWYFVFHRVFFIYLFIPFRVFWSSIFNTPIINTSINNISAIGIYTCLFYLIRKYFSSHKLN